MSTWDVRPTTTVSSRRDLFGGAVPTVVIDVNRTSELAPQITMDPSQARALARELNRAARALDPKARAKS